MISGVCQRRIISVGHPLIFSNPIASHKNLDIKLNIGYKKIFQTSVCSLKWVVVIQSLTHV